MRMTDILSSGGVQHHDGSGHHHARQGWIQVDCPFCTPGSGKFRMGYNANGKYWNCWTCGNYSLWNGLKAVLNLTDREVGKLLKGEGIEDGPQKEIVRKVGKLQVPGGVVPLQKQHIGYLKERGFDPTVVAKVWGIQGIGMNSKLPWRLFIPIQYQSETVSWTTRSLSDRATAKYITAREEEEKVFHKDLLFGEDFARHAIVVCEGPLDAVAIGPGAVATMGLSYTRAQLLRMSKYPVRVICFDSEPAAQRRADKLCGDLSVFDGATYKAVFLTGKDAADASKREILELRRRFLGSEGQGGL